MKLFLFLFIFFTAFVFAEDAPVPQTAVPQITEQDVQHELEQIGKDTGLIPVALLTMELMISVEVTFPAFSEKSVKQPDGCQIVYGDKFPFAVNNTSDTARMSKIGEGNTSYTCRVGYKSMLIKLKGEKNLSNENLTITLPLSEENNNQLILKISRTNFQIDTSIVKLNTGECYVMVYQEGQRFPIELVMPQGESQFFNSQFFPINGRNIYLQVTPGNRIYLTIE
jgi:hypothetical protein